MIELTRINGTKFWLNPMLFEMVERTPDTVVTLANGHKYVVRESPEAVADAVRLFARQVGLAPFSARKDDQA
ncbi:MAG: flagellar FlbD family protein [Alicyclobacillaceae bacterium]|nr:flagellar FlbD family protein [Alicyclobacillaceae bacterium]